MDVTLQKRCAKLVYVIPEGLRELMSDISREVLRSQPEHFYEFIADYLDALMITRENARVAARLVDSIIQIATMTVELLQQTGMSRDEADRMANIIQDAFKRYMAIKQEPVVYASVQDEEEEEHQLIIDILHQFGDYFDQDNAAIPIIQRAFREFKLRHLRERQMLAGIVDWRVAARSAIYLYRHTGVTMEEANRAATLIKAAYKGYYTRRIMRRLLEEGQRVYEEQEEIAQQERMKSRSAEEYSESEEEEAEGADVSDRPSFIALGVLQDVLKIVVPDDQIQTAPPVSAVEDDLYGEDALTTMATSEVTTEAPPLTESEGDEGGETDEGGGGQGGEPPAEGDVAPAEGEAPAPADGEAPAEGEAPAPAEGEAPAPAEGETPAPAEGEAPAPAEGEAAPPAE
ncbi:uncharacterized protein [Onthophagus taurus]|uniref:uncharacterized protein n=1 Tax=Onthophagus taurus TaxID=166361 RepID=UPI0039BE2E36